jgi:hypothetical protein
MWRVLTCAVLLGLWLMHGMYSSPVAGCHGAGLTLVSMTQPKMAPAPAPAVSDGLVQAVAVGASMAPMGDGGLCLSGQVPTAGKDLNALIALLSLIGLGLATAPTSGSLAPGLARRAQSRWRAPPGAATGSELLLLECVART